MSQRWKSGTFAMSWVLVAVCAALVLIAGVQYGQTSGNPQVLATVPSGVCIGVLVAVAAYSFGNPGAPRRRALGAVAALVLVGAAVVNLVNAAHGFSQGSNLAAWHSLTLAVVPLSAALGTFAVTWARSPGGHQAQASGSHTSSEALERRPSWSADHAVGASWTRAGDAATGAPATASSGSGWGLPATDPDPGALPGTTGNTPSAVGAEPGNYELARPVPGVPTAAQWASGSEVSGLPPGQEAPPERGSSGEPGRPDSS